MYCFPFILLGGVGVGEIVFRMNLDIIIHVSIRCLPNKSHEWSYLAGKQHIFGTFDKTPIG